MSNNSMESLLAWMKVKTRLLDWGMIVALERSKANLLMRQEYIRRFDSGSYLPPIRGEVSIVDNRWMQVISDFVMDVPLLSFENANLNDSKAMLTMSVVGGSQLTLSKESVGWKVEKVDEIDPLQGPKLYLDLLLHQVPGDVDVDGRIMLDLKKSDNFRLTFGETAEEQRLGGNFFKDLFNQLSDDKRIWPLGRIERGTNESMRPKSFGLRTQASGAAARDPRSSEHGNGAILAFVRMEDSTKEGEFPGENSDFRYLIPDDAEKDYSATVLFDWARLSPMLGWQQQLIDSVKTLFSTDDLEYLYNAENELDTVVVKSGGITIGVDHEYRFPLTIEHVTVEAIVKRKASVVLANSDQPFTLTLSSRGASMRWRSECLEDLELYYTDHNSDTVGPIDMGVDMIYELEAVFELVDVAGSDGKVETVMKPAIFNMSISPMYDEPIEQKESARGIAELILGLVLYLFVKTLEGIHTQFGESSIRSKLHVQVLSASIALKPLIDDLIKMSFGQAITHEQIRSPHDIGYFGRINPTQTSFVINPMQPLVSGGVPQQFRTEPTIPGVQWAVEALVEDAGDPGDIDANGLYNPPVAASIEGRFKRVRVTATDPGSGYRTSALVTVLVNELSIHPLIQICDIGNSVELKAGSLSEDELLWSIKNPVANESGEVRPSDKPEGDHVYHHGPQVPDKTYVLDEIEVKNRRTNQTRSVHVLALQGTPGLTVKMLSTDISQGQVQLEGLVNNKPKSPVWTLPLGGPGSIDASTGLYQADPTATERFVLIFAELDDPDWGKFEGHLILPLPLLEFPQVLEVLSQ
ncbi:hypothetical protein [Pseudomonas sp. P97.38]|uniref:hypothetical protein n=1 Tax=Pseudomonas sp. P97.38 TaxID=255451 RepID=UPI00069EC8B1|nr:hypothetical protein [Pseudomonas sp. P97.38]